MILDRKLKHDRDEGRFREAAICPDSGDEGSPVPFIRVGVVRFAAVLEHFLPDTAGFGQVSRS